MELKLLVEIWSKIKNVFSKDKIYPFWRFILCFFSADYFIRFQIKWLNDFQNLKANDLRTIEILYFIFVCILIYFLIYNLLEFPLRIIFHGWFKKRVIKIRALINKGSAWEKKRMTFELLSITAHFFHNFLFKYGILSSNDLNEPINLDFAEKEKEFNVGMSKLYRWILTVIHSFIVSIIVWKFYSFWFFVFVLIVLVISVVATLSFVIFMLNLDYLEILRLKLLKENQKIWK